VYKRSVQCLSVVCSVMALFTVVCIVMVFFTIVCSALRYTVVFSVTMFISTGEVC
jgi:hypothetical protein